MAEAGASKNLLPRHIRRRLFIQRIMNPVTAVVRFEVLQLVLKILGIPEQHLAPGELTFQGQEKQRARQRGPKASA